LLSGVRKKLRVQNYSKLFFPEARLAIGEWLREHRAATAMIDISDGLSTDLSHICEESGVGAELYADSLPLAELPAGRGSLDLRYALHGGDEYELLFTAKPRTRIPKAIAGVGITEIGKITRGKRMFLISDRGSRQQIRPQGWEHFH
jgi:thiamine-monophosphate kinase